MEEKEIKIFENVDFGQVRTMVIDSEPWFVGKDIAEILGYVKARNAISSHVDEEDKKDAPIQGDLGGVQNMTIINESGLYSLILKSRLPEAKKFKRWVTSEILPTIRKTGGYVSNDDMFINNYLPFADETTKSLFRATLQVVNNQNKLIAKKDKVIQGLVDDMPKPTKRKLINSVVRAKKNYSERWNSLYKEFESTYSINVPTRYNHYVKKNGPKKIANKIDYVDKELNMIDELYEVTVRLFESDVKVMKARLDVLNNNTGIEPLV